MTKPRRFAVIDLNTQIDEVRRFAVWDYTCNCFWKINTHHAWRAIDELVDDFTITFPGERFADVHHSQRDVIIALVRELGF